jgi:tRNA(fMet)-specific endonuclease VapC
MRYCIDSSVAIAILRGDAELRARVAALEPGQACAAPIVFAELFEGAYRAQNQAKARWAVEQFIARVELLAFTEDACRLFGAKSAELRKKGKMTQVLDLMIACVAIAHDATVVTRNEKDFANISGLHVEVW